MTEEFYHRDIFGKVVDIDLGETDETDILGPKKRGDFNIFALTDAVGGRDKRRAWVLYRGALAQGLSAEEVFFKVVWQVKCMLIASKTKSVAETDMKQFPYSKAKSFAKNFKENELEKLSESLVSGYYLARQGEGEIETLVEKLLLTL